MTKITHPENPIILGQAESPKNLLPKQPLPPFTPLAFAMAKVAKARGESLLTLQKKPFQLLGFSHCQQAMMTWVYCQSSQTPQSGSSLIDQSPKRVLDSMMSSVLKQSYIANYQNQLTFAVAKTKPVHFGKSPLASFSFSNLKNLTDFCGSKSKGDIFYLHNVRNAPYPASLGVQLQSFTLAINKNPGHGDGVHANSPWVLNKGTEFYSASWILYTLQQKLQTRNSNIKRAMQELFEKASLLIGMNSDQKILKGLTITLSGRSGRKQGMAKTVTKTIGRVPLSGLKQNVDYDQGFVTTKLGSLGIKVWVFY
jgi:hypothetical protein